DGRVRVTKLRRATSRLSPWRRTVEPTAARSYPTRSQDSRHYDGLRAGSARRSCLQDRHLLRERLYGAATASGLLFHLCGSATSTPSRTSLKRRDLLSTERWQSSKAVLGRPTPRWQFLSNYLACWSGIRGITSLP